MKNFNFKTLLLAIGLVVASTQPTLAKRIYLNPSGNWQESNAKFAIWYWGGDGGGGKWSSWMTKAGQTYYADIADNATSFKFIRFNSSWGVPTWEGTGGVWAEGAEQSMPGENDLASNKDWETSFTWSKTSAGFQTEDNGVRFWREPKVNNSGDYELNHGTTNSDQNAGTVTSLYLKAAFVCLNQTSDNLTGDAHLYYWLYRTTSGKNGVTKEDVTLDEKEWSTWQSTTRYPHFRNTGLNVNMLQGLASGKYTFEYYLTATKFSGETLYCSNNSSNFKVTFTYNPIPAVSNFGYSARGAISGDGTQGNPYLVQYGNTLTLTATATASPDANSSLYASWNNATYTNLAKEITVTTTSNITVKGKYYNSTDDLSGAETSATTIYYQAVYTGLSASDNGCEPKSASTIGASQVNVGSSVSVTAGTPADNYHFNGWTSTNGTFGDASQTSTTFTPSANNAVAVANWVQDVMYSITYPEASNFSLTKGAESSLSGQKITFTASANTGFDLTTVSVTDASSNPVSYTKNGNEYSFTMPASNVTIFIVASYTNFIVAMKTTTGGTITEPVNVAASSQANYTTAHYNVPFTITAVENTGYHFTGWTETGDIDFGDATLLSTTATLTETNNSSTATANFAANTYQVVFNKNDEGATGEMANQSFTYNEASKALTANNFVKTGYDFKGWATTAGGAVQYSNGQSVQNLTATNNGTVNLYAVWAPHAYTISYKDEGNITYSGENGGSLVTTHTYDQETVLVDGTKTGYTFQGWFTDSLCTNEHIITTIGGKAITTDTTLYAKWQINSYNITYPDAAAQAAGYFTITEAPAKANYQETVTFKAAPIYGYAGSMVSVTAGGVQLSQEGDTYTFVMGDADVTIDVTASAKRTCKITASCEDDWGTINDEGETTNLDMFTAKRYTFTMNPGLTFLKWNIANAKCASGYTERSYPTIEIIATSEEATISPAIMETYTNVTLNFEPTYMGYIKLNGNNIASGTKTDVSTRTTATIEACTNYGYKFVGWTATNNEVITLTNPDANWQEGKDMNTSHKLAGVTNGGKTVLTAHFEENTTTEWGIKYGFASDHNLNTNGDFNKRSGETQDKIGYFVANLSQDYQYEFKIYKKNVSDYSNAGTMSWNNCAGWPFGSDQGTNCKIQCGGGGTYVFILDFSSESTPKLTVLYPDQTISGDQKIYFYDYYNGGSILGTPKFRIGNKYYVESRDMVKVPGTTNLYEYQTHGWANYEAFHIASNTGYTGPNQSIYNAGLNSSWIGTAMDHIKLSYGQYIYLEPSGLGDKDSKTNTQYYHQHISNNPNVNATRIFRRNVVKPTQAEHGTIKVEQWLSDDGSNRQEISGSDNYLVDPSRWITITATAEKGYRTQMISVTTEDGNTENYYNGDSWDYVVHKDITNITATYELVKSNTFYVKNHADWITGGHDIWLHYWDATLEPNKKTNWAFPGRMATKMDDTKTWYAVTIENTFFNVNGWKLSQGNTERQTVDYLISTSTWDPANMNGKYYQIVLKNGNSWELEEITDAEQIPTFYRVLVTKGAQTFTSNTVQSTEETLSFFAADGWTVTLQKGSSTGWVNTDISNQFTGKAGVWTAKSNADGNALTDLKAYTGKYYIRTDGADGGWEDYKVDGKNNAFTYFTPRTGETYSYYWVATVGKAGSGTSNVKAKIANEYNNHLSVEIVNDKNTDPYGNINNATYGSNIRFSYEPTTNAFEREIISGSAGDVFLNVVGENLYSDVSCGSTFALNEENYKNNPKESKLADISDWVYEKTIYVNIVNNTSSANITLRSLYNNQRTDLYTGTVMKVGTSVGKYKLRATYDFKKNRIITSWSPSSQEIIQSMVVDADIQFLQVEKGDVSQISIKATTPPEEAITVSSLDYLLFVLEIEQGDPDYEHYRISLPFDCRISDIYGIGKFDELWGIQMYDGLARSQKGWLNESTNYWKWLTRDDTLKAGVGYSITVAKKELPFKTIEEEVTRTICNEDGTNCNDITTNESRAALRLYFPSMKKEHSLSRAQNGNENMQVENWACSIPGRTVADANWHFMGSTGYNNIKIAGFNGDKNPAPTYLYQLNSDESAYEPVSSVVNDFSFRSFKAYMFQYTGTINWAQYTRSQHSDPVSAPRYSATQHAPLRMQIKVMEAEESVAHAYIEMNDNASFGFDQNQDLAWMNSNSTAQVYTKSENEAYAANCIPFESAILPLTVKTLHAGDYTLHLEGANNVAVYLIDYQLQTETLISAGDVAVELEKGSSNERFALRFDAAAAPTDMQNGKGEVITNDGQKTQKLLRNGNIYLINAGRVYNATGVELR